MDIGKYPGKGRGWGEGVGAEVGERVAERVGSGAMERENARMKKLVAEWDLELEVMKELLAKKW
jgi:hypothetical protein